MCLQGGCAPWGGGRRRAAPPTPDLIGHGRRARTHKRLRGSAASPLPMAPLRAPTPPPAVGSSRRGAHAQCGATACRCNGDDGAPSPSRHRRRPDRPRGGRLDTGERRERVRHGGRRAGDTDDEARRCRWPAERRPRLPLGTWPRLYCPVSVHGEGWGAPRAAPRAIGRRLSRAAARRGDRARRATPAAPRCDDRSPLGGGTNRPPTHPLASKSREGVGYRGCRMFGTLPAFFFFHINRHESL